MSRSPTVGDQGIIEIIDATEELARQWQAGNSAAILVEFAEGVGVQVRRALPHLRAEVHQFPPGMIEGEGEE